MCYSENWSLSFTVLGLCLIIYNLKHDKNVETIIVAFYTLMELVQYMQYKVINECNNVYNVYLTIFTWLLVWIQPLMWNAYWYNITTKNKEVFKFTSIFAFIVFIFGVMRIAMTKGNAYKTHEMQIEGRHCARKYGTAKHLIWENNAATFYGFEPNWLVLGMIWFIPLYWLRPKRYAVTYAAIFSMGIMGGYVTSGHINAWASTWCLFSVPSIIVLSFLYKF